MVPRLRAPILLGGRDDAVLEVLVRRAQGRVVDLSDELTHPTRVPADGLEVAQVRADQMRLVVLGRLGEVVHSEVGEHLRRRRRRRQDLSVAALVGVEDVPADLDEIRKEGHRELGVRLTLRILGNEGGGTPANSGGSSSRGHGRVLSGT